MRILTSLCLAGISEYACFSEQPARPIISSDAYRNLFDGYGEHMLTVNIVCCWAAINCSQLADYDDLFEETRRRAHTTRRRQLSARNGPNRVAGQEAKHREITRRSMRKGGTA
jgi:hypothetical protein